MFDIGFLALGFSGLMAAGSLYLGLFIVLMFGGFALTNISSTYWDDFRTTDFFKWVTIIGLYWLLGMFFQPANLLVFTLQFICMGVLTVLLMYSSNMVKSYKRIREIKESVNVVWLRNMERINHYFNSHPGVSQLGQVERQRFTQRLFANLLLEVPTYISVDGPEDVEKHLIRSCDLDEMIAKKLTKELFEKFSQLDISKAIIENGDLATVDINLLFTNDPSNNTAGGQMGEELLEEMKRFVYVFADYNDLKKKTSIHRFLSVGFKNDGSKLEFKTHFKYANVCVFGWFMLWPFELVNLILTKYIRSILNSIGNACGRMWLWIINNIGSDLLK